MHRLLLAGPVLLTIAWFIPTFAAAPVAVESVAPLEDLEFEVDARMRELDGILSSPESFEELKEDDVWRAFGVLACMGQAIAEHPDRDKTEIAGPALRDAARQFSPESTVEEARAALAGVKAAQSGEAAPTAPVEHDWARLINMHPMMAEIEARSGKLVRVARRPRGSTEEAAHASTIAVLSVAMMADTHEVKNEADVPEWKEMSQEYQQLMTQLSGAIRAKDRKTAGNLLKQATQSCNRCHEKFRDQ